MSQNATGVDQNREDDGRISKVQSDVQPKDTKSLTKVKFYYIGGLTSETDIEGTPEELIEQYEDCLNSKKRAFTIRGTTKTNIFNLDNITTIEVTT